MFLGGMAVGDGAGGYGCCCLFRATFIFISIGGVCQPYYFSLPIWCLSKFVRIFFPPINSSTSSQITYTRTNKTARYFFRTVAKLGKARQRGVKDGRSNWLGEQAAEAKGCWSVGWFGWTGRFARKGRGHSFLLNFITTQYVTAVCEYSLFPAFVSLISMKLSQDGWYVCE
ncbi:hypothetical protein QBC45DRAFT_203153 [Copromyces sp. CBS 386.78]|nr:hypothetical protein QBC45DRAFT_203153 [Copromyces sp. CBS 386.78]